jgi:hypothetical protein
VKLLAAFLILLTGCSEAPMASSAAGCWGSGAVASSTACQAAIGGPLAALGHRAVDGLEAARAGGVCGGFLDCADTVKNTPPPPTPTPVKRVVRKDPTPAPTGRPTPDKRPTPFKVATADTPTPTPERDPPPSGDETPTPDEATPTPTAVQDDPVVLATSSACSGITVSGLESKAKLSADEAKCATDAATGKAGLPASDMQSAAIALSNTRSKGWQHAVEAALKEGSLANAPLLNFAGIEPAYNGKRYKTVLKRSRIVWNNRGKGYQFSGKQLDFMVEFSCRSAGQLALAGSGAGDGIDWCERWLDRAETAGKPTQEIEDLIRQVE